LNYRNQAVDVARVVSNEESTETAQQIIDQVVIASIFYKRLTVKVVGNDFNDSNKAIEGLAEVQPL